MKVSIITLNEKIKEMILLKHMRLCSDVYPHCTKGPLQGLLEVLELQHNCNKAMSVLRTELNMLCDSDYDSVGHLINRDGGYIISEISVACDENESKALNSVSR